MHGDQAHLAHGNLGSVTYYSRSVGAEYMQISILYQMSQEYFFWKFPTGWWGNMGHWELYIETKYNEECLVRLTEKAFLVIRKSAWCRSWCGKEVDMERDASFTPLCHTAVLTLLLGSATRDKRSVPFFFEVIGARTGLKRGSTSLLFFRDVSWSSCLFVCLLRLYCTLAQLHLFLDLHTNSNLPLGSSWKL